MAQANVTGTKPAAAKPTLELIAGTLLAVGGLVAIFMAKPGLANIDPGRLGSVTAGLLAVAFPLAAGLSFRNMLAVALPIFGLQAGLAFRIDEKPYLMVGYQALALGVVGLGIAFRSLLVARAAAPVSVRPAPVKVSQPAHGTA